MRVYKCHDNCKFISNLLSRDFIPFEIAIGRISRSNGPIIFSIAGKNKKK